MNADGSLRLKTSSPLSTSEFNVTINGTAQDAVDQDSLPIALKLWWEGSALVAESADAVSGKALAVVTRTEDGDGMRVDYRSPSGIVASRYFQRA